MSCRGWQRRHHHRKLCMVSGSISFLSAGSEIASSPAASASACQLSRRRKQHNARPLALAQVPRALPRIIQLAASSLVPIHSAVPKALAGRGCRRFQAEEKGDYVTVLNVGVELPVPLAYVDVTHIIGQVAAARAVCRTGAANPSAILRDCFAPTVSSDCADGNTHAARVQAAPALQLQAHSALFGLDGAGVRCFSSPSPAVAESESVHVRRHMSRAKPAHAASDVPRP